MIQVIYCSSLLSVPGRAGAFSRDFTLSLAPECRAFSGALKIEKLKAPLIPGPEGAVDTNEAVLTCTHNICFEQKIRKYHNFSSENNHFYSREILQYIARACYRKDQLFCPGFAGKRSTHIMYTRICILPCLDAFVRLSFLYFRRICFHTFLNA